MTKRRIRLTQTPTWLRMVRKFYAYLGAGALGSMFTVYEVSDKVQNQAFFWYGVGAFTIQLICDTTFKIDSEDNLHPDPINPKIKP